METSRAHHREFLGEIQQGVNRHLTSMLPFFFFSPREIRLIKGTSHIYLLASRHICRKRNSMI